MSSEEINHQKIVKFCARLSNWGCEFISNSYSVAQQYMRVKVYCAHPRISDHQAHEQMSRSDGQSEARTPVFKSPESLGRLDFNCDSRASVQHLSRWTTIEDMASINILEIKVQLSARYYVYFQWIPSYIGLNGNEIADCLVKSATAVALWGNTCLTFAELSSI
ncbi:hypothetical protein TNCV_4050151 [Trichonephila clavipes]|nr:hypothetical protein TNCV_4050151 [Trichonephila clavipes]